MIEFKNHFDVLLVDVAGDDERICKAARVSTLGADSLDTSESAGLINFLMKNRHGSPFEHGMMTFRISAPIFVWREFMRHRIGFSYNEQSGRYMKMEPVFYRPHSVRPIVQEGKPGEYKFVKGTHEQVANTAHEITTVSEAAWDAYELLISKGIANEVARMVLPVNIYSTAYVTCNPRSMMSFLSLRTHDKGAKFPSFPMAEIEMVASSMEIFFKSRFPLTYLSFEKNGRVSP